MRYLLFLMFSINIFSVKGQLVIKMKREGGVSIIPCKVNGLALNFIFDTGASDVSISMTEASFMLKNGYFKKEDIIGTTNYQDANGNINEGITIWLREITIADLVLKNVKASIVKNLKAPLLLGQSALRKLGKIEFNLDSNSITINPETITFEPIDTLDSEIQMVDSIVDYSIKLSQDEIYYQLGLEKFLAEDYSGSIIEFNAAIALNNSKSKIYTKRAIAKDMLKDWRAALLDYNKSIMLDPKNSAVFSYRAETRYRLGDTTGALSDLQIAIQLDPENTYAYKERGKIKIDRSRIKEALTDFSIVIKMDPEDHDSYYLRGAAKHRLKNLKGAIADFDTAISLKQDNALYWTRRGEVKFDLKNFEDAIIDLDQSLEIDSELGYTYNIKGSIAREENDLESAKEYFEKAIELNPNDVYAAVQLEFTKKDLKNRIWISLGFATDGEEWFMKNEAESEDYDEIKIWLKKNDKKFQHKKNGKTITYLNTHSLILTTVDCSAKKLRFEYFVTYDSKGSTIESIEQEYSSWTIVPPGSIGEMIVKSVCERYNN